MNLNVGRALSHFATALMLLFCGSFAFAGPSKTTYQAKIIKPDGYPLEASNVNFKFTILDPSATCILYAESYSSVNMSLTGGLISFSLGSGIKSYPASATTFEQIFSNITPNMPCDTGGGPPAVFTPLSTDTRKITMQFNDGSGWQTLPAMTINAVPYAMYANDSLKFNGLGVSDFVQMSMIPSCGVSEALRYNGSSFSCVAASGGGSVTSGSVISALGYTPANGASVTALTSSLSSTDTNIASVSSTVFSVSSTVSSLANTVSAITSSQWVTSGTTISYSSGFVGIGTSAPTSALSFGGTTTQNIAMDRNTSGIGQILSLRSGGAPLGATDTNGGNLFLSSGISTGLGISQILFRTTSGTASSSNDNTLINRMIIAGNGNVGIGTTSPVTKLDVIGGVRIGSETAACAAAYAGTLRYAAGNVEYCNGTSWLPFGVAGAGITTMNGSASGAQTFATGVAGTAFNISTANGVHTFNIPLASTGAVTAGLLSNSDYLTFTNKLNATSAAVNSVLGYTPANSVSVTALTSSLSTTDANVSSVSSTVASLATSLATIVSSQWLSSGTTISYGTGNVGIGTTNPLAGLHIVSDNGAGIAAAFQPNLTNGMVSLGSNSVSGSFVQGLTSAGSAGNLSLNYYGGFVGVGIDNPTAALHLKAGATTLAPLKLTAGSLLTTPASGSIEYDGTNFYITDGTNTRRAIASENTTGAISNVSTLTSSGSIALVASNTVYVSGTTASINSTTGALVVNGGLGVGGNINSSGTILTTANIQGSSLTATSSLITPVIYGGTGIMNNLRLESTTHATKGYILMAQGSSGGNVGIGTTMPLAKLYVDSDGLSPNTPPAGTVAVFDNESSNMGISLMTGLTRKASMFFGYTGSPQQGAISYHLNPTASLDKITFNVNQQERMVLTASATLGIGTSAPTAVVHALNTNPTQDIMVLKAAPSQSAPWIRMTDSGNVQRASISPNGGMTQLQLGVTNAIYLTSEYGGVNEVPAGTLVNSNGNLSIINSTGTAGAKVTTGYFNGSNFYSAWEIANVASGYGNLLLMKSGGNVGIGTTTPSQTAEIDAQWGVNNSAPATNGTTQKGILRLGVNSGANGEVLDFGFNVNGASGYAWMQPTNRSNLAVNYNMALNPNGGYVGIGTASPTTTADVNGTFRARGHSAFGSAAVINQSPLLFPTMTMSSVMSLEENVTDSTNQWANGISSYLQYDPATSSGTSVFAGDFEVFTKASNSRNIKSINGLFGQASHYGTGTVSASVGVFAFGSNEGTGAINAVTGLSAGAWNSGTGAVQKAYGVYVDNASSGPVTTGYGVYIRESAGTNSFGLYQVDPTENNYFAGNVAIGVSVPTAALEVRSKILVSNATNGSNTNMAALNSSATDGGYLHLRHDGTNEWYFQADPTANNAFHVRHGNLASTPDLTILQSGNIGIGTSSPATKLNISGLGAGNATALRIDSQDTYYRDIFMSEFNTTSYGGILRYHSGLDLLQLITMEAGVEKYGVAVARATGFVGIGMNSAAAYRLDVNGDIHITGTPYRDGGDIAWTVPSDARLKDVKRSYGRGLKEILNIDTIIYTYKKDNIKQIDPNKEFTGVLAQNVQENIPEAVKEDKDGFLSLNTTPIFWAMINAIKDLYHEVTGVQREIASLKEDNKVKEQEIKELKERLDRIEKSIKVKPQK